MILKDLIKHLNLLAAKHGDSIPVYLIDEERFWEYPLGRVTYKDKDSITYSSYPKLPERLTLDFYKRTKG